MSDTAPPLTLPERLTALITGLRGAIGISVSDNRSIWSFTDEVVKLLCRRRNRFAALFARFRAGTLPAPRPARLREARPAPTERARAYPSGSYGTPPRPIWPMPRRPGWLTGMLGWRVAAYANDGLLKVFLSDPELAEFLAAAPQAGRLLRPIWWMVSSQPLPEVLRPPPRARVRRVRRKARRAVSPAVPAAPRSEPRRVWPGAGPCLERPRQASPSTSTPGGKPRSGPGGLFRR